MKKKILINLVVIFMDTLLNASEDVKLYFQKKSVANGQTALLYLDGKDISKPKLTFENLNIDFLGNKNKADNYFALIPINYYTNPNKYNVIVSFFKNNEKVFKSISLNVINANYKSEILNVEPSKVKLKESDQQRVSEEYKEAMNIYKRSSKELTTTSFIHPMSSKITSNFGNKRVYNDDLKSFHSGTDYRAPIGTPIYASAKGVVKISKNRFYAGNSVVIDHGYGVYSMYAHLSKLIVKVGDEVTPNQLLGYSGNTGRVTGPHLHFSIRLKNNLVDPAQFIDTINSVNLD